MRLLTAANRHTEGDLAISSELESETGRKYRAVATTVS